MMPRLTLLIAMMTPLLAACSPETGTGGSIPVATAAPDSGQRATLVMGGGCFWCMEAAFELVPGVVDVTSGYAGGTVANPSYEQVCTGTTGHAEVVRITYDPQRASLDRLLDLFWVVHNPTTLNRQGNDVGTQYRSIILYADDAQRAAAEAAKKAAQSRFEDPIVTEIVPLEAFYPAEEYHQDYYRKNPNAGYCQVVVSTKVRKMQHALAEQPAAGAGDGKSATPEGSHTP